MAKYFTLLYFGMLLALLIKLIYSKQYKMFRWFVALQCYQAYSIAIAQFTNSIYSIEWSKSTWAPIEAIAILAAIASTLELVHLQTKRLDIYEKSMIRYGAVCVPICLFSLLYLYDKNEPSLRWCIEHRSWYTAFLQMRIYTWGICTFIAIITTLFIWMKPIEGIRYRTHAIIFSLWMIAHTVIAPILVSVEQGWLKDHGVLWFNAQCVFRAITMVLCAGWLIYVAYPTDALSCSPSHPSHPSHG